jgi:hypothetical protein
MKLEKGDFVKYRIMACDENGNRTNELLEEGEAQILEIDGTITLDNASGLIALPEECEKIKPKVRGNWVVSCDIECPKCGHDNDLMDIDEWWSISNIGENKELSSPENFKCNKCGFEMLITGTDY